MSGREPTGVVAEILAEAAIEGGSVVDVDRVTIVTTYAEQPYEVNTDTMPPQDLNEFSHGYAESAQTVVAVHPAGADD